MEASPRVRICLAASGGGHLRQLLDLRPFWEEHDAHFVTEDTPLARKLAADLTVHLVPHFAFGQLKRLSIVSALRACIRNLKAAIRATRAERPQLVVSTGAGAVFFAVVLAKLQGARFILIESFARFHEPSLFGRLTYRFADAVFVQSQALRRTWPDAEAFDPLVILGPSSSAKDDMALVVVGTVMPFDRLVEGVAALGNRPAKVIAQVGTGGSEPAGLECRQMIEFDELAGLLGNANVVFTHGGTGSLITALRAGCRVVAMPRRCALGEHYDDHQTEIVSAFMERGLIEVAEDAGGLGPALERALARQPMRATTDPSALIERLRELTARWFPQSPRRQPG